MGIDARDIPIPEELLSAGVEEREVTIFRRRPGKKRVVRGGANRMRRSLEVILWLANGGKGGL